MKEEILYQQCPICNQGAVTLQAEEGLYRCQNCGLALKERSLLGLFKKGRFTISELGRGDFSLARPTLQKVALPADQLKVVLGNVYTDPQLEALAAGSTEVLRPVQTIRARIILEQLNETTHLQINNLRRGHGPALERGASYYPTEAIPPNGLDWQDNGNLFVTGGRLVFPSDRFTFIRLDRRLAGVRAFINGFAVQRKGEETATYFGGCYPHEAALAAAFVMAKVPALRSPQAAST